MGGVSAGTPLQNNMDEFYSLVDFVNPGSLAPTLAAFKRVYGDVIARSRDRSASDEEKALGHERSQCAATRAAAAAAAYPPPPHLPPGSPPPPPPGVGRDLKFAALLNILPGA